MRHIAVQKGIGIFFGMIMYCVLLCLQMIDFILSWWILSLCAGYIQTGISNISQESTLSL